MDKVLKELYARRLMWMDKYIKEHVANEDLIDCWLENGVRTAATWKAAKKL